MSYSRKRNNSYAGWKPIARNTHFDYTAPLTATERANYVAAMKRLFRVYYRPIHDEGLKAWANRAD